MNDLQLAYFKSGVPHIDVPQDHAFFATMYKFAEKYKIKYILTGGNYQRSVFVILLNGCTISLIPCNCTIFINNSGHARWKIFLSQPFFGIKCICRISRESMWSDLWIIFPMSRRSDQPVD